MSEKTKRFWWLKLNKDFFNQAVIKKLRKMPGGDTLIIIYQKMQLLSLEHDGVLVYEGIEDSFEEELALTIDETVENVKMLLVFLRKYEMIETPSPTEFLLPEVIKNIDSECNSAARMRNHRERKKHKASLCDENSSHSASPDVTCDTEKEKSKLKEEKSREDIAPAPHKFVPPTKDEVAAYCLERKNNIDAEKFVDYYAANGWMLGSVPMKDWKAAVRIWEKNEKVQTGSADVKPDFTDINRYQTLTMNL